MLTPLIAGPGYDPYRAREAALRVQKCYACFDEWEANGGKFTSDVDTTGIILDRSGKPYGSVELSSDGAAWISFRGTRTHSEWMGDADFPLVSHPLGKVERGFDHIMASLVFPTIPTTDALFVTGHSLGSALAALFASAAGENAHKVHVITFASPRPGSAEFAANIKALSFASWVRIENTADVVPRVPRAIHEIGLDYTPIGELTSFTDDRGDVHQHHALTTYMEGIA
jgi:triacylglycerol lipase